MNAFRMFKYLASVVAIVFTLVFAINGQAQTATSTTPTAAAPMVIGQQIDYAAQSCNSAKERVLAAKETFDRTCAQAKLKLSGTEGCMTRAETCQEGYEEQEEEEEDSGFMSSLMGMAGGTAPLQEYAKKGCPDMTASEGREKERDFKTDIKDREREIDETKKDITDLQKKTSDAFTELNAKIAEADAEFKELQSKMSEDEIAAAAESRKALTDAAESLRDLQKNILTKEKQLAEAILNKASEMSKFTDFVIKNQCSTKIKEELRKMVEANKKKNSSQSLAKINSIIKNDAKQGYSECVNTLVESRNKVRLQFDNSIKTIEEDLAMSRQSLTDAQNNLKELQSSIEQAKGTSQTRKTDAYNNYLTKRANLAQELQLLSQNSASESRQLESKLQQLNMDLNNLKQDQNNFLASGRGGTKVLDDVIGDFNAFESADQGAASICGGSYKSLIPGKGASSTSKTGDGSE